MNIEFKVGDIVYAYEKGIWKILKIEERAGTTPLLTLFLICRENLQIPKKKIIRKNDSSWCRSVFEKVSKREVNLLKEMETLQKIKEFVKSYK